MSDKQQPNIALILVILIPLIMIGGSILAYAWLNRPQSNLYQIDALSGTIQWQQTIAPPAQAMMVDAQGSLLNMSTGHNLHQLVALDHRGGLQWKTFASSE